MATLPTPQPNLVALTFSRAWAALVALLVPQHQPNDWADSKPLPFGCDQQGHFETRPTRALSDAPGRDPSAPPGHA